MQFFIPTRPAAQMIKACRIVLVGLIAFGIPHRLTADPTLEARVLPGHIPQAVARAQVVSHLDVARPVGLALALPLRNQTQLADLLRGLSDPHDPRYGHYLTPQQFTAQFGPTQEQYDQVVAYAQSAGLTVVATHPNRTVVDVAAPAGQVEHAFGLHLQVYQSSEDGRYFFAPDADPVVPASVASAISGVVGLDNAAHWHPHIRVRPDVFSPMDSTGHAAGSGPGGGLTPANIKAVYNLSGVPQNGSGQTLGLFELDGYNLSDISTYESHFGLPPVSLQNVLVDGYSGAAGSGSDEVTLDIELQAALASGASKIMVYEGPNSDAGVLDTYDRIANDNLAKEISTSWGEAEQYTSASVRNAENAAFQQMAAQGQSIYAAAGDSGADDNGSSLSVDDPASQPYMVGAGGTSLTTSGAGGSYVSETTWNSGSAYNGAGGGGTSSVWSIPAYQSGVVSAASLGSSSMRNVPDVSLDADPNTGYAIYSGGQWVIFGGTSCAAPLWAAFTALVNQKRLSGSLGYLGFANTSLYAVGKGSRYTTDFHDIADGSTNLYFPAVTGYDDATGWGSFNGANLLADLSSGSGITTPTPPAAPAGLSATGGNGQVTLTWSGVSGATSYNLYRSTGSGAEALYRSGLTATSYTDTGLTNGTTYYYQVTAVNAGGESAKSSQTSARPQAPVTVPAAPASLTATAGSGQVTLSWASSTGAASYNLYRSTSSGTETLYKSGLTLTGYTDTGVTNGTSYYYKVTAVNSAGESARSGEASAKPQAASTVTQLLGDPGFENGTNVAPWVMTAGVIDNSTSEPAHSGSWKAWLDGYSAAHTDTVFQTVTIPSTITTATLNFYLHIDSAEPTTAAYDTLTVQIRSSSGAVLKTLATYTNQNSASGYTLRTFDVSAYKGQTIQVYLAGVQTRTVPTSFVVDDFALNVQ